jgi:hypothetical protein
MQVQCFRRFQPIPQSSARPSTAAILALPMAPLLAHSDSFGFFLFIGGLVMLVVCGLWSLIVAAQRSVLWLLAVIFVPFAGLVLLFVEPRSRPPFFAQLLAGAIMFWGLIGIDTKAGEKPDLLVRLEELFKKSPDTKGRDLESPSLEQDLLAQRTARLNEWRARLEANRAALKPKDTAAKAAFDRELGLYMAELEGVNAEIARQRQR